MKPLKSAATLGAASLFLAGLASAQGATATLVDGTVLTLAHPLVPFGVEGPIWELDPLSQTIYANGQAVPIAATVDGAPLEIGGTRHALGGGITAATFDALLDENAQPTGRDASAEFPGAVRSILASDRFAANADPRVVSRIQNHFTSLRDALDLSFPNVASPANAPAGPPSYAGGTLKCFGHKYLDGAGNPYFVPDTELVVELAENVAIGPPNDVHLGAGLADSYFTVGDLKCHVNTDPRFPVEAAGGFAPGEPYKFLEQVAAGNIRDMVVGGYMVGEGHMMVITMESEDFVDPTTPPQITAQSWVFRDDRDELRFRGFVDKPLDLATGTPYDLDIVFLDAAGQVMFQRPEVCIIDPLTGVGEYRVRSRNEMTVADVFAIEAFLHLGGVEVPETRKHWDRADVE
jgi:hypothetical protein